MNGWDGAINENAILFFSNKRIILFKGGSAGAPHTPLHFSGIMALRESKLVIRKLIGSMT